MPDFVSITPGSGADIATDTIAAERFQRVKLAVGAKGSATDLPFGQAAMAASLPVVVASDQSPLPVAGWDGATARRLLLDGAGRTVATVFYSALPDGAATAAKQPALGTAGTAATDVVTVQGIAGGTPQPISPPRAAAGTYGTTDGGFNALAVVRDTRAAVSATDGQYEAPRMSALGALDVRASQGVAASGSVTSAAVLFTLDCQDLQSVAVHVTSPGTSCTVTYEGSNDNSNWSSLLQTVAGVAATVPSTVSTAAGMYVVPVACRYFRARVSTYGSGIVTASGIGKAIPPAQPVSGASAVALSAGVASVGFVYTSYYSISGAGGASGSHIVAVGSTNATIVKASAGRVIGWSLANTTTGTWRYVKLHNQTTLPTAGTGVVRTIAIPPGGMSNFVIEGGFGFTTGIGLTIVTGSADTDATAVTAGDVVGELFFA